MVDTLFDWWDRIRLGVQGTDYEIQLSDEIEESVSDSFIDEMALVVEEIDSMLEEYDNRVYEVGALEEEDAGMGRYMGQERGRVQIELDTESLSVPVWAHEVGHDVAAEKGLIPADTRLIRKTVGEMIASLTMYQALDETDIEIPERESIFAENSLDEWNRLREVADPDRYEVFDEIRDAGCRGNWDGMVEKAREVPLLSWSDGSYERSMVASYFGDGREQAVERLSEVWRTMEYSSDAVVEEMFERIYETPMKPGDGQVAELVEEYGASDAVAVYDEVMCEALERTMDELRENEVSELDGEEVISAFGEEGYGAKKYDPNGYEEYLDLPHTVGYALAEAMVEEGHTVEDVVENPKGYWRTAQHFLVKATDYVIDAEKEEYDESDLL